MPTHNMFIAIDLKSFYASVECVERGLDPLKTNLVVADASRTEKTICLAVSPSLKALRIPGRARLFEVVQRVKEANAERRRNAPEGVFSGRSFLSEELARDASLEIDYIAAVPRMALYMEYSSKIYQIYLRYVAPEDIHVYSVDEVFMDVTHYLNTYGMTAEELAKKMILEVMKETGITATAGVGTNLYLCKVAMDIEAKHIAPDENGVRIAFLDERRYRESLWNHRPLTDFWRVGRGYQKKLEEYGMYTMGDVARCSLGAENEIHNEDLLYRLFGVNAELLIDHAWGYEPCRMSDIKSYRPSTNSLSSGQVLQHPYEFDKGRLIVREMTELLVLDVVAKGLVTDQIVLTVVYDVENLLDPTRAARYRGAVTTDHYGRKMPKQAHGSANLGEYTSSTSKIMDAMLALYDRLVNPDLLVRKIYVVTNHLITKEQAQKQLEESYVQLDLFSGMGLTREQSEEEEKLEEEKKNNEEKERRLQEVMLEVKKKFGNNAILKGMNLSEGAMTIERNNQIGGHKA